MDDSELPMMTALIEIGRVKLLQVQRVSLKAGERPLGELIPLVENLVSVLIARDYKSAELTALLLWMNSHCNSCGKVLTNQNQPDRNVPLCLTCA